MRASIFASLVFLASCGQAPSKPAVKPAKPTPKPSLAETKAASSPAAPVTQAQSAPAASMMASPAIPRVKPNAVPSGAAAFTTALMTGPYASFEALCTLLKKPEGYPETRQYEDPGITFYCEEVSPESNAEKPFAPVTPKAPYLAVKIISSGWRSPQEFYQENDYLALQTKDGWFIEPLYEYMNPGGTGGRSESQYPSRLELVNVSATEAPLILVQSASMSSPCDAEANLCDEELSETLLLCGVGASGRPSCTSPIQISAREGTFKLSESEPSSKKPKTEIDWSLKPSFPGNGAITFSKNGTPPKEQDAMLGEFPLKF